MTDRMWSLGYELVLADLLDGWDVRDPVPVARAVEGVDSIVHLAALGHDHLPVAELMGTNVGGTWNLLRAAASAGVERFVLASSVNAFGVFLGLRPPDYFPIDDAHPTYATSAYGASKRLAEDLCEMSTRTSGMTTICLRLPRVVMPDEYASIDARPRASGDMKDVWEYGAFLDVRDAASILVRAVESMFAGHSRWIVAADDAFGGGSQVAIADERLPETEWHRRAEWERQPSRPLVDDGPARLALDWAPTHDWASSAARARSPHVRIARKARALAVRMRRVA